MPVSAKLLSAFSLPISNGLNLFLDGILLLGRNHGGNRMNMSLSVEKAEQLGINVKHIFVKDDCAPNAQGLAGRRAACGIIILAKVKIYVVGCHEQLLKILLN